MGRGAINYFRQSPIRILRFRGQYGDDHGKCYGRAGFEKLPMKVKPKALKHIFWTRRYFKKKGKQQPKERRQEKKNWE